MALTIDLAIDPYDRLAAGYDVITAGHDHDGYIGMLTALARRHGAGGGRALDVACGTGLSTLPLVRRGYEVTGVDRCAAMLAIAERRLGDAARLEQGDMRSLPVLGAFDLVLCLSDSLNHLLSAAELEDALTAMTANLTRDGVLIFDVNTLATLREAFAGDWVGEAGDTLVAWRGLGSRTLESGGLTGAEINVLRRDEMGAYHRDRVVLEERHHPVADLRRRLGRAGLDALLVSGKRRGEPLSGPADELAHHKVVAVARRAGAC